MAYIDFWRRWKDFSGKTSRSNYLLAILTHTLLSFMLLIATSILFMAAFDLSPDETLCCIRAMHVIYGLVGAVPLLAMTVRRLRDAGYNKKSLWKLLIPGVVVMALLAPHLDEIDDRNNIE